MAYGIKIKEVIIHCTYTPPDMDIGFKVIDGWHEKEGWSGVKDKDRGRIFCGYHFIIRRDGRVELGRPLDMDSILEPNEIGAHARGRNRYSVGVVLVGGMRKIDKYERVAECNYTREQWVALEAQVDWIESIYGPVKVLGHNDVNKHKACPVFNVKAWRYGN